jgi:hypothetical protein
MNFRLIATLALVVAVTALFMNLARAQLRAPRAPASTGFNQEEAMATLVSLAGEQEATHPTGSAANKAVRDRIVRELIGAGYSPEIQSAVQCSPAEFGTGCSVVENIIAVHKGTKPGKSVLATAHYDSVAAGPGIGDDLSGTAIMLELAAVIAGRETKNDVVFLITDGEETGLRGAIAFAERHPLFKQVGVVVNVEARGASGPSMMFETGKGNAALVDLFARTVAYPVANSLTYEIYQMLPNDTDFSIYRKKANLAGFNFAFSNSASLYHSQNDNLANLDRFTLQHQGDNAFAVVGALADADLGSLRSAYDASYFDLHGTMLIVWPSLLNIPLALLALAAIARLIYVHRDAFSPAAVGWSAFAVVGAALLLFAGGWLLSYPLGVWPGVHPLDHPAPWPGRIALAATGVAVPIALAMFLAGRIDPRALALSSWLLLAALALALSIAVTGASYALLWPVLIFAIAAWIETLVRRPGRLAVGMLAGFVAIAFFWLAYLMMFELVLGFHLSHFKILILIPFVLVLTPALLHVIGRRLEPSLALAAGLAVAGVAAWVASATPAYAPDHPRGQNITYYDDVESVPRWLVGSTGPSDEDYLRATGFPPKDELIAFAGLFSDMVRAKPAADLKLPPPTLELEQVLVQDNLRLVRGTIKGGRGGLQFALGLAGKSGIQSLRVAGQDVANTWRLNQDRALMPRFSGFGEAGVQIEIVYDPKKRPTLVLIEQSPLPDSEEARTLVAARTTDAAPVHSGDRAVVVRKLDLEGLAAKFAQP